MSSSFSSAPLAPAVLASPAWSGTSATHSGEAWSCPLVRIAQRGAGKVPMPVLRCPRGRSQRQPCLSARRSTPTIRLHHSLTSVPHPAWPLSLQRPTRGFFQKVPVCGTLHRSMPALPGSWQHQAMPREPTKVQKGAGGRSCSHASVHRRTSLPSRTAVRAHLAWRSSGYVKPPASLQ